MGLTADAENDECDERRESSIRRKASRKNADKSKRCVEKEHDVDKVITFLKEKKGDGKQRGELDYFFASACESTKLLPRRLQLRVKQQIMATILNAEMECLDSESSSITSPSPTPVIPGPSPTSGFNTPSPTATFTSPSHTAVLSNNYPGWSMSEASTSTTHEQSPAHKHMSYNSPHYMQ